MRETRNKIQIYDCINITFWEMQTIMNEIILISARDWHCGRELLKGAQEVFWGNGKIVCSDQNGCYKTCIKTH